MALATLFYLGRSGDREPNAIVKRTTEEREAETVSWKTMLEGIWSDHAVGGEGQQVAKSETDIAAASIDGAQRKTVPLPSILGPVRPPNALLPKGTPANLRRFAESPVPRRAINVIKDRIAGMDWQIQLRRGYTLADVPDAHARMEILRRTLEEPNDSDSFRSVVEQALEDALVGGFGAIEMERTDDPERPFALWPVDGATIQLNANWDGDQSIPRYAQNTNGVGPGSRIPLHDNELMYIRLNPRSHTPFGLGSLEVAFEAVNSFLAAHRYAGRLASNSVVQYALWLNETTPDHHNRLLRWWQDEIEGTGRVPLLTCEQKPEVLKFTGRNRCRTSAAMAGVSHPHDRECVWTSADVTGPGKRRESEYCPGNAG